MTELDALAAQTCSSVLTAGQLKDICRWRGFAAQPGASKLELAAFVATRLLQPEGAARAMQSLEPRWLLVLHALAMANGAPNLEALLPVLAPGRSYWRLDYRKLFREVAEGLLNRGLVLVQDRPGGAADSRFQLYHFVLPAVHEALLPPYPVATCPLGKGAVAGELLPYARQILAEALRDPGSKRASSKEGLVARAAAALRCTAEGLAYGTRALRDMAGLVAGLRADWTSGGHSAGSKGAEALRAIDHILRHLPPGRAVTPAQVGEAVAVLGHRVEEDELQRFFEEGWRLGLLLRSGSGQRACYAPAPESVVADPDPPVLRASPDGIWLDPQRSGLECTLRLAALCRAEAAQSGLLLRPQLVLFGRAADELDGIPGLRQAMAASPAFADAAARVKRQRGRLLLHVGLVVLRVEETGLRMQLIHELGKQVRSLGGPYLVLPQSALPTAERLVRREGYAPRREA